MASNKNNNMNPDVTKNPNGSADENTGSVTEQATGKAPEAKSGSVPSEKANRVSIFIPRAQGSDEKNLLVSVNGVNYLLPKGKSSEVPDFVAAEIQRSWKAQTRYDQRVDELKEAAKQ